jgi:hypothetical protein
MNLKLLLTAVAPIAVLLTSCLKSHNSLDVINDDGSIVTVISDVGTTGGSRVVAVNAAPATEQIDFITLKVYAPGNNKPSGPVHVKLAITNASGYDPMPPSGYSLPLEYDVPAGANGLTIPITLNKNSLDLTKNYGIQVSIASVSHGVIGENDKTMIVSFQIKNQWDGTYNITWTNYHPTANPGYTGSSTQIEMHTNGPSSVKIYWPLAGAYCAPAILNGGLSYFLIQEPNYTVNTSTNAVAVQNVAPGAVTFYSMAVGFNSRWDPATKTFYVKWGYSYAVPGVFDAACREWNQTIAYTGPR